jgi:hypothetical protein
VDRTEAKEEAAGRFRTLTFTGVFQCFSAPIFVQKDWDGKTAGSAGTASQGGFLTRTELLVFSSA